MVFSHPLDLERVKVSVSSIGSSSDEDTIGIKGKEVIGAGMNGASNDIFKSKSNLDHLFQGGPSNGDDRHPLKPAWV